LYSVFVFLVSASALVMNGNGRVNSFAGAPAARLARTEKGPVRPGGEELVRPLHHAAVELLVAAAELGGAVEIGQAAPDETAAQVGVQTVLRDRLDDFGTSMPSTMDFSIDRDGSCSRVMAGLRLVSNRPGSASVLSPAAPPRAGACRSARGRRAAAVGDRHPEGGVIRKRAAPRRATADHPRPPTRIAMPPPVGLPLELLDTEPMNDARLIGNGRTA
jgi:hypothetical protein